MRTDDNAPSVYRQFGETVFRFAVTHRARNGCRVLTFPAQGRYTYATDDEASKALADLLGANSADRLRDIYGADALATFSVERVECWAGHFDPCRAVFDDAPQAKPYQPKTGAQCSCRRGVQRDNCPACEGTGWVIDFAAIRARVPRPHGGNDR